MQNKLTKADILARQRANHFAWLIALGADQDEAQRGVTYRKLLAIENRLHKLFEKSCNGELVMLEDGTEPELERAINQATAKVMRLFGGSVPDGFFINQDPRGYALKINDSAMRDYFERWRNMDISSSQDWGGYGILAPDLN